MDLDAIRRVERIYRARLRSDPADTLARVRLAWCLFAQALHEAGRESAFAALQQAQISRPDPLEQPNVSVQKRDSTSILDDSLRQTYTALHLSASKRVRQDAMEILALARIVSGDASLGRAEKWADDILEAIMAEVIQAARSSPEAFPFEEADPPKLMQWTSDVDDSEA
jgi:hypothetical protein